MARRRSEIKADFIVGRCLNVCDIQKGGRGLNVDNLHLVVNRLLIDVDSVDRLQRSVVGMNVICVRWNDRRTG
jgi:hypothetical protein